MLLVMLTPWKVISAQARRARFSALMFFTAFGKMLDLLPRFRYNKYETKERGPSLCRPVKRN